MLDKCSYKNGSSPALTVRIPSDPFFADWCFVVVVVYLRGRGERWGGGGGQMKEEEGANEG